MYSYLPHTIAVLAAENEAAGRTFYTHLHDKAVHEHEKTIFEFLATQEEFHEQFFRQLSLSMMVDEHTVECDVDLEENLRNSIWQLQQFMVSQEQESDLQAALTIGIHTEQLSIDIYTKILEHIPSKDVPVMQTIIEEEKKHLAKLISLQTTA